MPSFDFIPPLSTAGASKKPAPADDANEAEPAEKFQTVMVRAAELFSPAGMPVKTHAGPDAPSDAPAPSQNETTAEFSNGGGGGQPAHKILFFSQTDEPSASRLQRKKTVEAGHTRLKRTDTVHPALAAMVLNAAANVLPVAAEPASPVAPMKEKTISPGVIADNSENAKSAAGPPPASVGRSGIFAKTVVEPEMPAKKTQTGLMATPGTGKIDSFASEEQTLPPGKKVKLPETAKQPAAITNKIGPDFEAKKDLNGSQTADGTAVAQQDKSMKMAAKKTKRSGLEQKLPGSATVATGDKLQAAKLRVPTPEPAVIRNEWVLPASVGLAASDNAAKPFASEMLVLPILAPAGPPYVQRTQELISLQILRLCEAGADEMRVVIRPDAGLQLSLHLQQRGGGVEVEAFLERGNFGLLNRHWPELQQQLESRGVRVAPLANADLILGGGSEGFRHPTTSHGQQAGDDADPAETPVVLLPGLPPAAATASASRNPSRRLETWA